MIQYYGSKSIEEQQAEWGTVALNKKEQEILERNNKPFKVVHKVDGLNDVDVCLLKKDSQLIHKLERDVEGCNLLLKHLTELQFKHAL